MNMSTKAEVYPENAALAALLTAVKQAELAYGFVTNSYTHSAMVASRNAVYRLAEHLEAEGIAEFLREERHE